ncbi:PKD domain-containing protein [Methanosarcina sp. MSH10X1]|uniref:PKD domain-containing protein n=1 Tax=Methanosarcina sp. MSH10X1 TaxID=2507075 RepID=UPI000FFB4EA6|nr:PKD domain-containing protein [Methanosarcina sp. MSH10X1]RXA16682.1 PKD domain-containing protein [Methanosarcina sp. MSH10X1]
MKKLIAILALLGALSVISVASAQSSSSQSWGSIGNESGQFYGMSGVATDISGNIYVAELDSRVQKFSLDGTYLTQFDIPARSIAIDSAGNIYATVNDSIQKFNSNGTLLNTWGSTGTENGYFKFPTGIALDSSGNIYVSDMENNRIQKLDPSGRYVISWGTLGSGNGNFKSPAGIVVNGDYIYVADTGNYRIQKFDLNGNYVSSLGSKGTGNTQFNGSIAVASDLSKNIYVADYYNGRVLEYDSNFNYLNEYTGLSYPTALVKANDNLYVLDSGNYRVCIASHRPPDQPPDQHHWGSFGNKSAQFYGMSGIAADNSGNIYVAELDNRVQKFSRNGAYLTQFNIPARDIAIDPAGNIYATVNDSVQKLNSNGTLLNTWGSTGTENGTFRVPAGVALDSSGNIYVSDMNNNRIQKLDSSGRHVTSWGTLGSGNENLDSPTGITVSGSYVYVADMGNCRIQKFDLNGNYISSLGSKGTDDTQFNSSIAVANDSAGNIYVADYFNGRVLEYDSNFNYLNKYTGLSYPTALDIVNDTLYVLDSGNYQVVFYNDNTTMTPMITWNTPADIPYGTALNSAQLNANASVPGNFTYTPAAGTVLEVGTHILHVDFTPADAAKYTTTSKEVTINVSGNPGPIANFDANVTSGPAPLTVRFTNLSENATALSWNFGDGNSSTEQNPVHTYSVEGTYTVSLNASNANGYNISTKSNLITVNQTTPGLVVYYDGSFSGNFLVDLSGNGNTGYATSVTPGINQSTGAKYIDLNGVNSKIDIPNNAQTNISSPVTIEFYGSINNFTRYGALVSKYNRSSGWYLSCSPEEPYYNQTRFSVVKENGTISKAYNSKVNLTAGQLYHIVTTYDNNTSQIYINGVGDPVDARTWNSPAVGNDKNITIGFGYDLTHGNCSMYTFRLYNRSLSHDEIKQNYYDLTNRTKQSTLITWNTPADIINGTALSSTQLNAAAIDSMTGNTVNGTFVYTPAAGTVLSVGTYTLHVNFTPTDTVTYEVASADVQINVTRKPGPIANFTADVTSGPAPLTVRFTDLSENATSLYWDFGDGSSSAEVNPVHVYNFSGLYTVNLTASNANGTGSALATINVNKDELQLWTFDASKLSDVPDNIYTASKDYTTTSNVSLTYNSTLGSVDSIRWHNDGGETYITGAYPTVNENLTFTMGVDSSSPRSYGNLRTSVAFLEVKHALNGSYEVKSYWMPDNSSSYSESSSLQIPASSVINNRVTVSIHSYDSNRTNVITAGPELNMTTPYRTGTTRKLQYTNVIQPLIFIDGYASGKDEDWVNVHLYNITQSIPRDTITPYARDDIMGFGLDYPSVANNKNGTDFLISRNQTATVYVSEDNLKNSDDVAYDNSLFANGFEEGMHSYPGLATVSFEQAKTIIDSDMALAKSTFGSTPVSWSCHENKDNVTHANYIYNKYGALYRNGMMGMGFVSSVDTLWNETWPWWSVSSEHGAICPCFTHETDYYPARKDYSIDPEFFKTFVTNLNSKGINLVGFSEWYYSSMAQTATTDILQSDENSMKFQLNTTGGYPVNLNLQTVISPSHLDCNGVSIPFERTSDGIKFRSVGNGTYTLTNVGVPPKANFTAKQTGSLMVQFNDTSSNSPNGWNWDFGDGNTSTSQNVTHIYSVAGNYTVSLTSVNGAGSSTKSMNITAKAVPTLPNCTNPPKDLDNDGLYEDIIGNEIVDFDDVIVLYESMDWIKENNLVAFFDYDRNSLIDFDDIIILYKMI